MVSNPKDTAPPRGRPGQQSLRHGATQTTPCSPILFPRRHPDHVLDNPQDTAPPRGHAGKQSPWHSRTHATRPAAILMAQRHTRHARDTPDAHRHSLPLRSTAQRRTRDTPDAACRCVPRNVRPKLTSTNPRIPCACHDFATPNTRTRARTRDLSHRATKSSDFSYRVRFPARCPARPPVAPFPTPATRIHLRDTSGGHLAPHLPRETHAHQRPNARFPTPATRIHPPVPSRARTCVQSPTPATRNACHSA